MYDVSSFIDQGLLESWMYLEQRREYRALLIELFFKWEGKCEDEGSGELEWARQQWMESHKKWCWLMEKRRGEMRKLMEEKMRLGVERDEMREMREMRKMKKTHEYLDGMESLEAMLGDRCLIEN